MTDVFLFINLNVQTSRRATYTTYVGTYAACAPHLQSFHEAQKVPHVPLSRSFLYVYSLLLLVQDVQKEARVRRSLSLSLARRGLEKTLALSLSLLRTRAFEKVRGLSSHLSTPPCI